MKKSVIIGVAIALAIVVGVFVGVNYNDSLPTTELVDNEIESEPKHHSITLSESAGLDTP